MSWLFSQALVAAYSADASSAGAPFAPSKWCVLGADSVGAPHHRERIWILA